MFDSRNYTNIENGKSGTQYFIAPTKYPQEIDIMLIVVILKTCILGHIFESYIEKDKIVYNVLLPVCTN